MTTTGEPLPNTFASIRCRPAVTTVVRAAIPQTLHQKAHTTAAFDSLISSSGR